MNTIDPYSAIAGMQPATEYALLAEELREARQTNANLRRMNSEQEARIALLEAEAVGLRGERDKFFLKFSSIEVGYKVESALLMDAKREIARLEAVAGQERSRIFRELNELINGAAAEVEEAQLAFNAAQFPSQTAQAKQAEDLAKAKPEAYRKALALLKGEK